MTTPNLQMYGLHKELVKAHLDFARGSIAQAHRGMQTSPGHGEKPAKHSAYIHMKNVSTHLGRAGYHLQQAKTLAHQVSTVPKSAEDKVRGKELNALSARHNDLLRISGKQRKLSHLS